MNDLIEKVAAPFAGGLPAAWLPIFPGAALPPLGEKVLLLNNYGVAKLAPRWGKLALDIDEHYWLLENEEWAFSNFTHYLRIPAYPTAEETINRAQLAAAPSPTGGDAASDEVLTWIRKAWDDGCNCMANHSGYNSYVLGYCGQAAKEAVLASGKRPKELKDSCNDFVQSAAASLGSLASEGAAAEGWISVDERQPEVHKMEGNYFTVYASDSVLAYEKGEEKAAMYYCNERGQWRQCGLEFHGHYAEVTHWQPLPTPPQAPATDEN